MDEMKSASSGKNFVKDAWIKLATEKSIIHALRTLAHEEVRSSLVSDDDWKNFIVLISPDSRSAEQEAGTGKIITIASKDFHPSFFVHLSLWFLFLAIGIASWIWWLGQRREWWGQSDCQKCNHPVEKRKSFSALAARIKKSNLFGSSQETLIHSLETIQNCDIIVNSHTVEACTQKCSSGRLGSIPKKANSIKPKSRSHKSQLFLAKRPPTDRRNDIINNSDERMNRIYNISTSSSTTKTDY